MHKTTAYTELRCFWVPLGIKISAPILKFKLIIPTSRNSFGHK